MKDILSGLNNSITPLGAILMLLFNPITLLGIIKLMEKWGPEVWDCICELIAGVINLFKK